MRPGVALALLLTAGLAGCAGVSGSANPDGTRGPGHPGGGEPAVGVEREAASVGRSGGPPVGLDVVRSLRFPPLEFDPPEPTRFELSNGVTVFFLRDPALPLVDVFVNVRGGHVYADREEFAAASALLPMMKNGGTRELSSDSLDEVVAFHALGLSSATNGSRLRLAVSALRDQLDLALDVWSGILLRPRFEPATIEQWRRRELEAVRRLPDVPGSLAVIEFNRILFRENPTGWRMTEADLAPDRVTRARLQSLHRRMVCPENAVVGAVGDVSVAAIREALERTLGEWQPCGHALGLPEPPTLLADPTVYVIHRPIAQSTIVMGLPGRVRMEIAEPYFASRIANWVLGGSGFTSRLSQRLRTEEGLAYTASSVWGASPRHERILGGITHTAADQTVEAARAMLETFRRARTDPPTAEEVELARESIVNGFVFGFDRPAQVVSRQVAYHAAGLPLDWLARYLDGIRDVDAGSVSRVLRATIDTDRFTVVIVGDTTAFDARALGPVRFLEPVSGE